MLKIGGSIQRRIPSCPFLMKLKQKSRQSRTRSQIWQSRCLPPRLHRLLLNLPPQRMPEFVQEELKTLQETIRQDARSGKYQTVGGKHLFDGTRLWHEGDYRQGTALLANFYPFLSRDRMQEKEILTQSKRLFSGYRYEVRYTLSKDGAFYFNYFKEEMKKQGFVISDLSVSLKDGSFAPLPFTASGTVRYDFELEHYLSDYPKLYYTWHLEVV